MLLHVAHIFQDNKTFRRGNNPGYFRLAVYVFIRESLKVSGMHDKLEPQGTAGGFLRNMPL